MQAIRNYHPPLLPIVQPKVLDVAAAWPTLHASVTPIKVSNLDWIDLAVSPPKPPPGSLQLTSDRVVSGPIPWMNVSGPPQPPPSWKSFSMLPPPITMDVPWLQQQTRLVQQLTQVSDSNSGSGAPSGERSMPTMESLWEDWYAAYYRGVTKNDDDAIARCRWYYYVWWNHIMKTSVSSAGSTVSTSQNSVIASTVGGRPEATELTHRTEEASDDEKSSGDHGASMSSAVKLDMIWKKAPRKPINVKLQNLKILTASEKNGAWSTKYSAAATEGFTNIPLPDNGADDSAKFKIGNSAKKLKTSNMEWFNVTDDINLSEVKAAVLNRKARRSLQTGIISSLISPPGSKRSNLSLYRPPSFKGRAKADASSVYDNDESSDWKDWKELYKELFFVSDVPFIDSHCHLDLLFRRTFFSGTFTKYRSVHDSTFPPNYFGCVTVFCHPKTWNWKSEGWCCVTSSFILPCVVHLNLYWNTNYDSISI